MQKEHLWQKYYPEQVPLQLDIPDVSLYYFLEQAAAKYPTNQAIIFMEREISYGCLKEQVDRLARALDSLGVKKGDRVAVMLPNCPQTVITYYALIRLGAVGVMTNPVYVERELSHQLMDSGAETIIFLDQLRPKVENAIPGSAVKRLISTSIQAYLGLPVNLPDAAEKAQPQQISNDPGAPVSFSFEELLLNNPPAPPPVELDLDEDLALLQYTGGTTGQAKGAMLTHRNLVANVTQVRSWLAHCREGQETVMCVLPFYHVYAMTTCMNLAVILSSAMIVEPRLEIDGLLKDIEKYRPTLFQGAPALFNAVTASARGKKYDISSIVACVSGSAPLPVEVQQQFEAMTGGKLVEGYGLTEASPVTHCNPIYGVRVNGSIGLPLPNTLVKIVDLEDGTRELPVGEIGELCVKGPQVMKGYWNLPLETAAVLRDGWLYTGDIARMDENGFTYIVDRKKDMVITCGFNVYPREVEEVLYMHPKVKEAAVIGVPDHNRGEILKAFIVLKEGQEATKEEIIKFCRRQLAKYKVPKKVEFRADLPKSMVGKILRRVLAEEEKAKSAKK